MSEPDWEALYKVVRAERDTLRDRLGDMLVFYPKVGRHSKGHDNCARCVYEDAESALRKEPSPSEHP